MGQERTLLAILIDGAIERQRRRRNAVTASFELAHMYGGTVLVHRRENGAVASILISFTEAREEGIPPSVQNPDLGSIDC